MGRIRRLSTTWIEIEMCRTFKSKVTVCLGVRASKFGASIRSQSHITYLKPGLHPTRRSGFVRCPPRNVSEIRVVEKDQRSSLRLCDLG